MPPYFMNYEEPSKITISGVVSKVLTSATHLNLQIWTGSETEEAHIPRGFISELETLAEGNIVGKPVEFEHKRRVVRGAYVVSYGLVLDGRVYNSGEKTLR